MRFKHFLVRARALVARRRVEHELDEELAFHIERETRKHIADGVSPAEAHARARACFGSVPLAADQCRDARGTAIVDTLAQDIRYAFRMFRRAPLAAVTIVGTVALGLGLIAVVFTLFDAFYLRVDAVQRPSELFAVSQPTAPGAMTWVRWTRREYEALHRETSAFAGVLAMIPGVEARVDGRRVNGTLVTGNFFEVLGTRAGLGRALAPSDDEPAASRPLIVLSHGGWRRLFEGDRTAIGRTVSVNGKPYEIVGVMPRDFRGLGVSAPDWWAPLGLAREFQHGGASMNSAGEMFIDDIVGRLKPGLSPQAATSALTAWASGTADRAGVPRRVGGQPASVRLTPRQGALSVDVFGGLKVFAPIFFAFGLILFIGCANVANLLLARGVARQREFGVRLSLGAPRRRIVRQLLTESLLLALAAAAGGFFVSRLLIEGALSLALAAMPPELAERMHFSAPSADWRVVVFIAAGAVISTVVFGLVPALRTTRLDLMGIIRGGLTREAGLARMRHALIALQVGASALLLISAAVFLRGALGAATVDFGLRTNDTLSVPVINEPARAAILQALAAHPSVAMVTASSPAVGAVAWASEVAPDSSAEAPSLAPAGLQFVSPEYFTTLGIDVLTGRAFTPAERSPDAGVVIVSQRFARRFWPDRDAVGRVLRFQADPPGTQPFPARTYVVVGIVKTVASSVGPVMFNGADLYLPIRIDTPGTSLALRIHGDPDVARRFLLERLSSIDPALDDIVTLRATTGITAYVLRMAFWVTVALGALALGLTVSGLFSVLSYLVAQRTKEIGVRMALGATTRTVAALVLRQSFTPVGLGVVGGGALASSLAMYLMSTPASSLLGGALIHVYDPVAYAASLLVIVTACALAALIPAWRAARINPIETLRQD